MLTPNGVAYQPLNVLSKCLIWNRKTVYFKEKQILCSSYKRSLVRMVTELQVIIAHRNVRLHLCHSVCISTRE